MATATDGNGHRWQRPPMATAEGLPGSNDSIHVVQGTTCQIKRSADGSIAEKKVHSLDQLGPLQPFLLCVLQ
jgi:hypothetical protein